MSKTSWQVKQKYNNKAYKRFTATLRQTPTADGLEDLALIEFIENDTEHSCTDYFRRGVKAFMEEDK